MESQIKQIKINATNIKSTLFNSNKQLKKLRVQERNLFRNQQIERKRQQKEAFVESQKTGGGVLGSIGSRLLSGPMSLLDRIKQFFGTILLGILVNNLPRIYAGIQKFLDDNKNIIETIKTVLKVTGNAIMGFIDVFNATKDIVGKVGNTVNQIKSGLDELSKFASNIVNETSILNTDILSLDKDFKAEFKDEYTARTTQQIREDVKTEIKQSGVTKKQFSQSLNQYRTVKNQSEPTQKVSIPGVGSYQRVKKGFWEGGLFGGTKEVTTDAFGSSISPQEFDTRFLGVAGDVDNLFQGYSKGGTVRQSISSSGDSFPGESGTARKARESTQSFVKFENNEIVKSSIISTQEESNKTFEELIKNFKEVYKKDEKPSGGQPPTGQPPGGQPPGGQPPGGQPPGGQPPGAIPPPDPNAKGSVITFDSKQGPDASGEPGVDFSFADIYKNYAIFPGKVVEVGSLYGAGYGRHVVVRSTDTNGKKFDALYAHFGNFAVKEGDMVQAGDYLGSVGWDIKNNRPMPGAGNMTGPHTSVDFYKENTYRGEVTGKYPGSARLVQLIVKSANKDVKNLNLLGPPVTAKKANTSGGQRYGIITQTFDDSGDTQVAMIFAQQPVIVPGPTRYITRTISQPMPYPVAIHPKSSGLRSLV